MQKSVYLPSEEKMLIFGSELAKKIQPGSTIFLSGQLGAGKTTLARGLIRGLGIIGKVKSPTYTLVEPYVLPDYSIYHFDFYRLEDLKELIQIGLSEYFTEQAICIVEWAEKALPLLPKPHLICNITVRESGRLVELIGKS